MSDPEPCPCPICGGTMCNVPQRWAPEQWVVCHSCGTSGPTASGAENAIAAWNRRAGDDEVEKLRARVERLEALLRQAMDSRAPDLADAEHPGWSDRARAALEDRT